MATISSPLEKNRLDLQLHLTRRIAAALLWGSLIGVWALLPYDPIPVSPILATLALGGTAWVVLRWVKQDSRWVRWGLVGILTAQLLVNMLFFANSWLPFVGLLLVFISFMLVSWGGFIPGMSTALMAIYLHQVGLRDYALTELLILLTAGSGFTWLAVNTMYSAIHMAQDLEQRAVELLVETRKHRGELGSSFRQIQQANDLLRRTQQELVFTRQQADDARRAKERFAANISHELRTPLNLILGFSEVMYLNPEIYGDMTWPTTLRRDIYHIYQSSRHLLEMIDDILDLSRLDAAEFSLNLQSTKLEPFLKEVVTISQSLFRGKPIEFEYQFDDNLPDLEIDRTRIRQVLLNLLNNASRYTLKGFVHLRVSKAEQRVEFSVSDTGQGIPEDKLEQIFQEFYQLESTMSRQYGGAGLGLAISRHFVQAHGGNIWVESQVGKGSTFFFTLPIHTQTMTSIVNPLQVDKPMNNPLPCLILVNAGQEIASLLRRHLDGFEIYYVENPALVKEAIRIFSPRAIIWNRLEESVPILDSDTPVIGCTLPGGKWLVEHYGAQAVLTKPVSGSQLLDQMKYSPHGRRLLIVDDDPGFVQLIERVFQATRPDVVLYKAYDGKEGMISMKENHPDLVFLDIAMPEMDGYQVLDEMHNDLTLKNTPVVLLTATALDGDISNPPSRSICLHQANGLTPGEVYDALKALIQSLRPRVPPSINRVNSTTKSRAIHFAA